MRARSRSASPSDRSSLSSPAHCTTQLALAMTLPVIALAPSDGRRVVGWGGVRQRWSDFEARGSLMRARSEGGCGEAAHVRLASPPRLWCPAMSQDRGAAFVGVTDWR